MRDLRLYYYGNGTLYRWGRGKTGGYRHQYNDIEDIRNKITDLFNSSPSYRYYRTKQFPIVEYFKAYNSKIIELIQYDNE